VSGLFLVHDYENGLAVVGGQRISPPTVQPATSPRGVVTSGVIGPRSTASLSYPCQVLLRLVVRTSDRPFTLELFCASHT
jgi:hypothetical protein